MIGLAGVETVAGQLLLSLMKLKITVSGNQVYKTSHGTDGAVTMQNHRVVSHVGGEAHGPAMTTTVNGFVLCRLVLFRPLIFSHAMPISVKLWCYNSAHFV